MNKFFLLLFFVPLLAAGQKLSSVADKTKGLERHKGFLNFYLDNAGRKIWLEINKFDSEMLYQTSLPAGVLLTCLLSLSVDNKVSFQARADGIKVLSDLNGWIGSQQKAAKDPSCQAHLKLALERMKKPEDAKPSMHSGIPPGSPIGMTAKNKNHQKMSLAKNKDLV